MTDAELHLASTAVTELLKEALRGLEFATKRAFRGLKDADVLSVAAKRYFEGVERRHNSMRIFGMSKPIPLTRIYTRVNILERLSRTEHYNIDDLKTFSDLLQRRLGPTLPVKPGMEAVEQFDKLDASKNLAILAGL